jgi:subfamily B ATP-binding cassette protein HlyB/CyaB
MTQLTAQPDREKQAFPAPCQDRENDSGLYCLLMMAGLHGIAADADALLHEYGSPAFSIRTILLGARKLGLAARHVRQDPGRLDRTPVPVMAMDHAGRYFIVGRIDARDKPEARVLIQHPRQAPQVLALGDFLALWSGDMIFFKSQASYAAEAARFDFTWFIPAVVKYRRLLGEVLLISLVLQLIGLVTPMFFQVVMDKVLVNHAMKTLNVIAIGLVCATVFEALLTGIRTYVFSHASSKMDVELGARLFRHLLALPISYFQARRVGDSVARIRELENIRSFLTGNGMTLVLDLLFSFVFIGVMFWYSVWLTPIVLASVPLYATLSLVFTPVLRRRLNDKFNKSAENQSFLVETISGMDTVKAMAVEPRWQQKWEQQLAAYVAAGLSTTNIATVASGGVTLLSKLVTAAIMWMGAGLVVDGKLTVGELVAFNMLAGQVASPILRLA